MENLSKKHATTQQKSDIQRKKNLKPQDMNDKHKFKTLLNAHEINGTTHEQLTQSE